MELFLSASCEFYYSDVIRYGNVAVEIIPQETTFCYSFSMHGQNDSANTIHSEIRPVYGDKCLRDKHYMFGVKSLFMVKKCC